jgi:hypothetical protein
MASMKSRPAWAAGGVQIAVALLLYATHARADAGWFETGDVVLRIDLQVLDDAGVIRLPVSHWPLPRAAVEYALANAKDHAATNAAVMRALERVRARVTGRGPESGKDFDAGMRVSAGSPGLLRQFDELAREEGELSVRMGADTQRAGIVLNATAVTSPQDGNQFRLDGSHATVQLGNWLLSANTLDRFWGPSHDSSLILSNNARPIPSVQLERAAAMPFETPVLSWLGPWRFSLSIGQMEQEREDIDSPRFLAWRVVVMPFHDIEFGFSRTAQFCGEQLACDFSSLTEMLIGNDNVGIDASAENEPGNQLAGFDIRWASPIGNWPYAIYSQMIGEDESGYMPVKYLELFGAEAWKPTVDGGMVQIYGEYADSTCSANRDPPRFGCAYNQEKFTVEGYRYRDRVIGYTTDRDAESYTLGGSYTAPTGEYWSLAVHKVRLNRGGEIDPRNTVSAGPADYGSVEFGWRGMLWRQRIDVSFGIESLEPRGGERDVEAFGFVRWTHDLSSQ